MDDDLEYQANLLKAEAANHLLQAAYAIGVLTECDDSIEKEWADSRIGFFHQTADELHPTEETWPEHPGDNVIPISNFTRRK